MKKESEEISREEIAALLARESMSEEMTREQAINYLRSSGMSNEQINTVVAALSSTGSSTEKQDSSTDSSTDAISRQAAIDAIRKDVMGGLNYEGILTRLPPVTPKQRTGRWIMISPTDMCCSECNEIEHLDISRKFCAYCGAKMQEVEE